MVNLLFIEDDDVLTKPGVVRSLYDPTIGTGGMVSVAEDHPLGLNPDARPVMYGQELNAESYAICKELSPEHIEDITRLFGGFEEYTHDGLSAGQAGVPISRIFKNEDFGYRTTTVERPQRDEAGEIVLGQKGKGKGKPVPDSSLRDTENVPLSEDVQAFFAREVLPHAPDLPAAKPLSGQYCVYVLECSDGSFYKGQTSDFPKRLKQHENGEVSWTAKHLPVKAIHWEVVETREKAVTREKFLKSGKGREWLKRQYEAKKLKSFERQAGAWIDETKTKVGYEIPFNRHFYVFKPPRPLDEIDAELKACTDRIRSMLDGIVTIS